MLKGEILHFLNLENILISSFQKIQRIILIDKQNMKQSLDILYIFLIDPLNKISQKLNLLKLLDNCLKKKKSIFINFFLSHKIYKVLIKYLKYENLYDEDRFMLFFNNKTVDYDKAIDFYQLLIILFIKWDKKFGKTKNILTPFKKNIKRLIKDNKEIKKYVFYIENIQREIKYYLNKGMKFIIFVKFLFKIEDNFELQNNLTYICEYKNKQPFKIDKFCLDDYKLIDIINENENTNAIFYFETFCETIVNFLENFIKNEIKVEILFDKLKKLILNYNKEFCIRDKFNYENYKVPKNFKEILKCSFIQDEKNTKVENLIKDKKLENSIPFSVNSGFDKIDKEMDIDESSEKIIKTYKMLRQPKNNFIKNPSKKVDMYYCTQQPVNNTKGNFIKKDFLREYKLKKNVIQKLIKDLKNFENEEILKENFEEVSIQKKEIDFFDFETKEVFFGIENIQLDNTALVIEENEELFEDIKILEDRIKFYEKKINEIGL